MDLQLIKYIINTDFSDQIKQEIILESIASDKKAIPYILDLLERERKEKKELIKDLNFELSRTDVFIQLLPKIKQRKNNTLTKEFILGCISELYKKHKGKISNCFKKLKG